jgi:hypothetical protein
MRNDKRSRRLFASVSSPAACYQRYLATVSFQAHSRVIPMALADCPAPSRPRQSPLRAWAACKSPPATYTYIYGSQSIPPRPHCGHCVDINNNGIPDVWESFN